MFHALLFRISCIFPIQKVFAHCDIPCGIYTAEPALTAARTVLRMAEKLKEADLSDVHGIARFTSVKEEHAQKCKQELLILWTDYFKEDHVAMLPNLHEIFWKAAKLCSKAKQEANMETAQALKTAVDEIAKMFKKAEAAKEQ